jgi:acyl dehydratase
VPQLILESPSSLKDFVGREIATTNWCPITQDRITQFAEATEDRQWIHTDLERARKESPYGGTVAHGFLTLSLLSHFVREAIEIRGARMGINYGLNRARFPSPVRAGAKIRARIKLQSEKEFSEGIEVVFNVEIECENAEKPCCVAEWIVRYYF